MRAALAVLSAAVLGAALSGAAPSAARQGCAVGDGDWIRRVCYSDAGASPAYGHAVLGKTPEWTGLTIVHGPAAQAVADGHRRANTTIFPHGFFEDIAPRPVDLDDDGRPEIIAVHTDPGLGARLVVIASLPEAKLLAATPFIGRRHRWLAPLGAADLDGDGRMEIAYVETPHIAPTLKLVRLDGDHLAPLAQAPGLTNHRFGDPFIQGRIATCDGRPTILTADAGWTHIIATLLTDGMLTSRAVAIYAGPHGFDTVPGCD